MCMALAAIAAASTHRNRASGPAGNPSGGSVVLTNARNAGKRSRGSGDGRGGIMIADRSDPHRIRIEPIRTLPNELQTIEIKGKCQDSVFHPMRTFRPVYLGLNATIFSDLSFCFAA